MKHTIIILTLLLPTVLFACGYNNNNQMRFLESFFGSNKETKKENSSQHEEEWEFYFSNVDEKLSSIMVDLGLHSVAPLKDKSNVIWISLKMNNPRQDGLSSQEESEKLGEIEDVLVEKIVKKNNAIFVGRLTSDSHRDFYFYIGDTTLYDKTISDAMVQFSDYQFDYGAKEDKEWNGYFNFLYPLPRQLQAIQNRRVVDNLEEHGDKLEKPREVYHWIYFKAAKDRETFLEKIKSDGFKIEAKDHDKGLGEYSYTLKISRIDKVDLDNINDYCLYLWETAQECDGDYDGWETSVEK
jgi:uncharacterized protein (TIGR01619 family)